MKTTKLNRFTQGINNVAPETDLPDESVRDCINGDITDKGRVRRRQGFTKLYAGSGIHSLYNRYFVENGFLKFLNPDNTSSIILSGLSNKSLSYCYVNNVLHFSSEDNNGTVNGPWGVPDVSRLPVIDVTQGGFLAGRYLISFANVSSSGELGGATNPVIVTLQDNEAIQLNVMVNDGYDVNVYLSAPNGKELFLQQTIPAGVTTANFTTWVQDGRSCETLFMKQILPGHIIRHFKGRVYVANGPTLWYTEAQRYGLYKPSENFFQFPERISVVQETENGIFVVSDRIYFISGTNPKIAGLGIVGMSTGVEGTGITVDASEFNLDTTGKVAYWYGSKGAVLGMSNGQISYISDDRFNLDINAQKGVTGYREQDGIRHLITNLFEQDSKGSGFRATDNAVAQVIRNGVAI